MHCHTDKKHANAEEGETIKKIRKVENQAHTHNIYTCAVCDTGLREIENLIPLGLLEQIAQSRDHKEFAQFVHNSYTIQADATLHLDMKRGITKEAFHKLKDPYLAEQTTVLLTKTGKATEEELRTLRQQEETPKGSLVSGWNDLLRTYTKQLDKHTNNDITIALTNEQKAEWLRIGETVTNWTCAYKPRRA